MQASRRRPHILYPYYLFLILSTVYIYLYPKDEGFLILNELYNGFWDTVMRIVTWLGDGIVVALISIAFMLVRVRIGLYLLISYAISGILAQLLKKWVFPDLDRPLAYFMEQGIAIRTIEGLEIPLNFSFPSGHTTSAFALFIGISFFVRSPYLRILLLMLAALIGYSRIYLAMHFPVDVVAGSILGVLTAYICFIWISGWKKQWLDVSLQAKLNKAKP